MITRNCALTLLISAVPYLGAMAQSTTTTAAAPKPDIVVFLTDDQSQLDTSLYGNLGLETPNLEKLAADGMMFSHAYVASPSCAPSRAALLTGLMPARNGAEPNHARPKPEIKKWPAYFHDLGYEVHAFGKISHYKHTEMYGFDSFAHDTFHDHAAIPAAAEFLHTRRELQEAGSTTATKPLCLMVGSNWPHVPWPEKAEGIDADSLVLPPTSADTPMTRDARTKFAAAVRNADNDLGTIMKAASEALSSTNTIFLFSSDHGTQWPFGKWNLYESGIRVPLVVRWPGNIEAGSKSDAVVSWIDFLPTLLEAAKAEAPENIDGKSFLPVLLGQADKHRDRLFTTHSGDGHWNVYPMRALTEGQYKYILNLHPEFAFTTHIDIPGELGRTNYWDTWEKLALKGGLTFPATVQTTVSTAPKISPEFAAYAVNRYYARPAEEFYDLSVDPHEQNNLAGDPAHAERLASMRKQVEQWMAEQDDQKKIYGDPHLLTDTHSYGPNAEAMSERGKKKKK